MEINDQPIRSDYYDLLNDDNDDDNNIPGTSIENSLPDNKGVEDEFVPSNEYINDEIIVDDDESLASEIDPLQNLMMEI